MSDLPLPAPYAFSGTATRTQAHEFCRRLARSHYENFLVASLFLPADLRSHFYSVYAYCRVSDDLADETGDPARALRLLDQWEVELDGMFAGRPRHPVFVALAETVERFAIPANPFRDLLTAFRQDQRVTRYADFDAVLGYCAYSANPVGRLVLYLCGYSDEERFALSDCTCTALQLANFWQDVGRDMDKGRIYIPAEDLDRFGCTEQQIRDRRFTPEFGELMAFEVARTRALFEQGRRLETLVGSRVALDIAMFREGGMEVLRRIESQDGDVLSSRPSVPRWRQFGLLARRLIARRRS